MSDFGSVFEAVSAEVADGPSGSEAGTDDALGPNADIWFGDDESDNLTDDTEGASGEDVDGAEGSTDEDDDDSEDIDVDGTEGVDDDDAAVEFDFDSMLDQVVDVTVNGETFQVPLKELRDGYMRQADYTRKTQAIAADAEVVRWAKVLRDSIQNDPVSVVTQMASGLGLEIVQPNDPWNELVEADPSLRPLVERLQQQERRIAELSSTSQQAAQDREQAAVRSEMNDIQAKYADFDPQQVIPVAIQHGVRLETAYKIWKADNMAAEQQAAETTKRTAEEAAARRQKAKNAKAKVSNGASKQKAAPSDDWMKFDSFEDIMMYEMSK